MEGGGRVSRGEVPGDEKAFALSDFLTQLGLDTEHRMQLRGEVTGIRAVMLGQPATDKLLESRWQSLDQKHATAGI